MSYENVGLFTRFIYKQEKQVFFSESPTVYKMRNNLKS